MEINQFLQVEQREQCGEESLQSVGTVHWGLDFKGITVLDLRSATDLPYHEQTMNSFHLNVD